MTRDDLWILLVLSVGSWVVPVVLIRAALTMAGW